MALRRRFLVVWAPYTAPPNGEDFDPVWKREIFETHRAAKVRVAEILTSGDDAFGAVNLEEEQSRHVGGFITALAWTPWQHTSTEHWANFKGRVVLEEKVAS